MPPAVPPPRPRRVFRLGFAGHRDLAPMGSAALESALQGWMGEIATTLTRVHAERFDGTPPVHRITIGTLIRDTFSCFGRGHAHHPAASSSGADSAAHPPAASITRFYSGQKPLLRLVTGLCEGGDQVAISAFRNLKTTCNCVETRLAAVLPCDIDQYRAVRPDTHHPDFDAAAAECEYITTLDGILETSSVPQPLAHQRTATAYRTQGTVLPRHCDLLIAAGNPDRVQLPGSTIETVRTALAFEIPVLFIDLRDGSVRLLDPTDDFFTPDSLQLAPRASTLSDRLENHVRHVVANKPLDTAAISGTDPHHVLEELFGDDRTPPLTRDGKRYRGFRERLWRWARGFFFKVPADHDRVLDPFRHYVNRAEDLNGHYASLYRGAFLANFLLGVFTVFLAAISLGVLAGYYQVTCHAGHEHESSAKHPPAENAPGDHATPDHQASTAEHANEKPHSADLSAEWARWESLVQNVVLGLGVFKLILLSLILLNTKLANAYEYNERSIDYRYLAERLRAMSYLPCVGSFQPPIAKSTQYASRIMRQSAIDWLFEAIVRAATPAELAWQPKASEAGSNPEKVPLLTKSSLAANPQVEVQLLRIDPQEGIRVVRDHWIKGQSDYHRCNSHTYFEWGEWIERWIGCLSLAVILFVVVDVAFALLFSSLWFHLAGIVLIVLATVIPATIAAMNGFRFQAECTRLHERSSVMHRVLGEAGDGTHPRTNGRFAGANELESRIREAIANPATNPGAWALPVLRFTESLADDFVQEVAEWSTLYAKEVPEPG